MWRNELRRQLTAASAQTSPSLCPSPRELATSPSYHLSPAPEGREGLTAAATAFPYCTTAAPSPPPYSSACRSSQPGPPPRSSSNPKLRSILVDKQQSEPNTPVLKNPHRPMHRNLSDLGPRVKKRVTYRCASYSETEAEATPTLPPSILKKPKVQQVPSEPEISEVVPAQELEEEAAPLTSPVAHTLLQTYPCDSGSVIPDCDRGIQSKSGMNGGPQRGTPQDRLGHTRSRSSGGYPSSITQKQETDIANYNPDRRSGEDLDWINDSGDVATTALLLGHGGDTSPGVHQAALAASPPDDSRHHLKPESQSLLMRPEVLKLRKTSC